MEELKSENDLKHEEWQEINAEEKALQQEQKESLEAFKAQDERNLDAGQNRLDDFFLVESDPTITLECQKCRKLQEVKQSQKVCFYCGGDLYHGA